MYESMTVSEWINGATHLDPSQNFAIICCSLNGNRTCSLTESMGSARFQFSKDSAITLCPMGLSKTSPPIDCRPFPMSRRRWHDPIFPTSAPIHLWPFPSLSFPHVIHGVVQSGLFTGNLDTRIESLTTMYVYTAHVRPDAGGGPAGAG
jgi:hypothetical protein